MGVAFIYLNASELRSGNIRYGDSMKSGHQGFTLIELMIVIAIIAILSAIALPAYNDYVTRSQVAESMSLAGSLKTTLSEYGANNDAWPNLVGPTATPTATDVVGTLNGRYVTISNTVGGTYPAGTVTVTMKSNTRATGTVLFVTADGGSTWTCNTGTVVSKFRPTACR